MEFVTFETGSPIFSKGDKSDRAFIIQTGKVEIKRSGDRIQDHVGILGPGALFGEVGLLTNEPRLETAIALERTTVELVLKEDFAALYDNCSLEIQKLINALSAKIREVKTVPVPSAEPAVPSTVATGSGDSTALADALQNLTKFLEESRRTPISASTPAPAVAMGGDRRTHVPIAATISAQERKHIDFGPILPLLEDSTVNDILINGPDNIFVERHGKLIKSEIIFPNDAAVLKLADQIAESIGRPIDRGRPLVDARLPDGSRVNIIAQPLAVDGTSVSIRKFSEKKLTLDIMAEQGNLSSQLADFLKVIGRCRMNILISGGTGAGKTTLLNAISQHIAHDERIVTIEDAAELQLQQPHVVRLETKPLGSSDRRSDEVTMRDLVKNALRMRPDRIIVGEVRGPEAFDMMQAMNTGHEGSMSTIHSNHPRDALSRLENMIGMANLQIPMKGIRYQIASALNLVVQISRMRDGRRRVTYVSEIVGMEGEMVTMQDLFVYLADGESEDGSLAGRFKWTGVMPRFLRRVSYYGEEERLTKALGVKLPKLQQNN